MVSAHTDEFPASLLMPRRVVEPPDVAGQLRPPAVAEQDGDPVRSRDKMVRKVVHDLPDAPVGLAGRGRENDVPDATPIHLELVPSADRKPHFRRPRRFAQDKRPAHVRRTALFKGHAFRPGDPFACAETRTCRQNLRGRQNRANQ